MLSDPEQTFSKFAFCDYFQTLKSLENKECRIKIPAWWKRENHARLIVRRYQHFIQARRKLTESIFTTNLRLLLKAPEQSENYTLFNWPFVFKSRMVKIAFEKQFIRKREQNPSFTFSAFFFFIVSWSLAFRFSAGSGVSMKVSDRSLNSGRWMVLWS